ncbi:aspartic peptidase domain-containing protein [Mycena alexandri]|uniref:Aspartic peptidase domain-containing protein n=1 Tax=Mycena alexandri TaxID=1745969 RepID=A0AAD6WMK4_9AGAR|nr:aspartic peptidase domain-containing protein [Mycena alexandri]KAJ7040681.1 aspartic peptidase domain-containing protein [Mycena alexandri]
MRGAVLSWFPLFLFLSESWAVKLAIQRRPQSASSLRPPKASNDSDNDLFDKKNQVYAANITINGLAINVALDMDGGETDLWVSPPEAIPSFNDTKLKLTIGYGDDSSVAGDIGVGKFALGQDTIIPRQAFLSVNNDSVGSSSPQKVNFDNGIFGSWGIGFGSNDPDTSRINQKVQTAFGANTTWGQNALASIFALNQTGSDYIGLSLSRLGDPTDTADGSLTISEYDSDYQAVANSPRLPLSLLNLGSWTVPLDGLSVNGKRINWNSTVLYLPTGAGYTLVQLDLGMPNIVMPAKQAAVRVHVFNFAHLTEFGVNEVWIVPCNASIDVVASFGGQDFPIHPLDLTDLKIVTSPDGTSNYTACVGTIIGAVTTVSIDALFGDSFLRNVYTVFDFGTGGNTKGSPFVQMLSTTDNSTAQSDLITVRSALMANMPLELSPIELVRILNGTENSSGRARGNGMSWIGTISLLVMLSSIY